MRKRRKGIMGHIDAITRLSREAMMENIQNFFQNKESGKKKDIFSNMIAAGMKNKRQTEMTRRLTYIKEKYKSKRSLGTDALQSEPVQEKQDDEEDMYKELLNTILENPKIVTMLKNWLDKSRMKQSKDSLSKFSRHTSIKITKPLHNNLKPPKATSTRRGSFRLGLLNDLEQSQLLRSSAQTHSNNGIIS